MMLFFVMCLISSFYLLFVAFDSCYKVIKLKQIKFLLAFVCNSFAGVVLGVLSAFLVKAI